MVKCSRCGVEVEDSWKICPNCGNNLNESPKTSTQSNQLDECPNCESELTPGATFCASCGAKIEQDTSNRCENCGSEVPENVIFCPTCGNKVPQKQKPAPIFCANCGFEVDSETVFCPECGANVKTGKPNASAETPLPSENKAFMDKINFNSILKPTILALVVAIILSSIGLLLRLSWISFILAIILSCGFFGGTIDNDANALVSGFFVGLILGFLETPLVQFWYGVLAAGFYEGVFGGQIIVLIILGIVCSYVSNMYLKERIQKITNGLL